MSLRKIMQMLEDMVVRIYTLHHYTRYDKKRIKGYKLSKDYDSFVSTPDLDIELLKENFSFNSNHFRHALRVSIATTIGYILSFILKLDYSYWVLLTILVILKPTYSLSKQRNLHRLLGTVIGAAISFLVLYLILGAGKVCCNGCVHTAYLQLYPYKLFYQRPVYDRLCDDIILHPQR